MVRLQRSLQEIQGILLANFNTIMVRLQLCHYARKAAIDETFQYHNGSIATPLNLS